MHELLYPLMQGYDSVYLHSDVELGGTDQKFNILVGRDLQRMYDQEPQVVFLMPILEGTDGVLKMSKSYGNYIGITEPAAQMYGKVMSIPDSIIGKYFELATYVPMDEVNKMLDDVESGSVNPMEVKMKLAREIVKIYHSAEAAQEAEEEFTRVVRKKELPSEIERIHEISKNDLKDGKIWIVKLLMDACSEMESKREARRHIGQGSVYFDGSKVTDPNIDVEVKDGMILKAGPRVFVKLKVRD
ncbi:MAG: tyrosine--tRNA ligase [Firmicutes bacterium]|nr:tyrosine--tRNA ligase [Bacillota bacterium]